MMVVVVVVLIAVNAISKGIFVSAQYWDTGRGKATSNQVVEGMMSSWPARGSSAHEAVKPTGIH